jgi:hypothetical protein
MKKPAQLSAFDASQTAFWIRFERELTSRWEKLEHETEMDMIRNPSSKKHSLLNRFFDDAQEQMAGAIHTYFPKMLQVATTGRQHIGHQSPLAWTQVQVWTEICNFLGMDEQFEGTSAPREDSRVLRTALRISTDFGSETSPRSLLPAWVEARWALMREFGLGPDTELSEADTEPLSLVNTKKWAKWREDRIYTRLEKQIDDEKFDGIIEAGKAGISVVDRLVPEKKIKCDLSERDSLAMQPATAEHGSVTAEPHPPVYENVPGDLGEWAERYLPELKRFVSRVRTGDTLDVLRIPFRSLFAEVIDRLPLWKQKRLFDDACGRRLSVPDLMAALAEVKYMAASTLIDHRKQYRRKSGTSRTLRSVVPRTK